MNAKKSLMAQLGFSDPDLREPLHEYACAYLQSASGSESLVSQFRPAGGKVILPTGVEQDATFKTIYCRGERDRILTSGRGDRRKTFGFVDVVIHHRLIRKDTFTDLRTGKITKSNPVQLSHPLIVEVMINRQELGLILRRFKLMLNFLEDNIESDFAELKGYRFVLATAYDPTSTEIRALDEEGVQQVVLGTSFERYVAERNASDACIPRTTQV